MISDRVAVKELCRSTLAAHMLATTGFEAVTVHYGDPGESLTDEMVVLGEIEGASEAVAFGPAGNDDTFTIKTTIFTTGHATAYAADQRAQDILDQLNAELFRDRFAASLQARVYPGSQNGPNSVAPLDGQPAAALVELDVIVNISVRGA